MTHPTQQQLLLPLLETLADAGGKARAEDVCRTLGERMGADREQTSTYVTKGRVRLCSTFDRKVRWARQNAVLAGLVAAPERGIWELTKEGDQLRQAPAGVCIRVIVSDLGSVLWGDAQDAVRLVEDGSVQLAFTSPPYPLVKPREYGGWSADTYLETLLGHLDRIRPKIGLDGSMVINLADVYQAGMPTLLPYQEQLVVAMLARGWHLCGKQIWVNPSKPKTTPWVTRQRERLANGFETFYWWAPTPRPYANNRMVLEPYSEQFRKRYLRQGGQRVSGHSGSRQSHPGMRYAIDNGGSIPFNVFTSASAPSGEEYVRHAKRNSLPVHPARMPAGLAQFWIQFTTEEGDVVLDPFAGSLTTAAACEALGRRYLCAERSLGYCEGGFQRLAGTSARWMASGRPE